MLLIILLGTIFLYRRNIRLRSDVAGRRLAKAGRVAQRRLKQAEACHLAAVEHVEYVFGSFGGNSV